MKQCHMYLSVLVAVMAVMGLVNADECISDIQNCGGNSGINPSNVLALALNTIGTVCSDSTTMNTAVQVSKCVFGVMMSDACKSPFGQLMANLPPIDWYNVLTSFTYICANKDAFTRATTCVSQYAADPAYAQCMTNTANYMRLSIDRTQTPEEQSLQAYCTVKRGVDAVCMTTAYLPNCQAGDLDVIKASREQALPPTCAASGFESFSIILLILSALAVSILKVYD